MKQHKRFATWVIAATFIVSAAAFGKEKAAPAGNLEDAWSKLPAYKLGDSRQQLEAISDAVIKAATEPAQRAEIAKKLASYLSTDATFDAKDFCCRQLYVCATAAEIPAVAKLLPDEKLSHMSRYVLERMTEPAAGAALRDAMATVKGNLLIGVVNSLGARRDVEAVPALIKMLGGADAPLCAAAAAALGRIAGPDATKALAAAKASGNADVKSAVIDSYLLCADDLLKGGKKAEAVAIYEELRDASQPARIRLAALRGIVVASPEKAIPILIDGFKSGDSMTQAQASGFVRQISGEEATKAFAAALPSIAPAGQVVLIETLAARGDVAAKPAILALVKSDNEAVRIAAIKAIGSLGNASDITLLADLAAKTGPERDAARQAIARVRGADADEAILGLVAKAPPEMRAELLKALGARRAVSVVPALLDMAAKDDQETVRCAALDALGLLAADKDFPALVNRLVAAKTDAEREAAKKAMGDTAVRMKSRDNCAAPLLAAMEKANPATKVILLSALTRIGGSKTLEAVKAATKDTDASVQDAAVKAITQWPDASAVADLLVIAKSTIRPSRCWPFAAWCGSSGPHKRIAPQRRISSSTSRRWKPASGRMRKSRSLRASAS